MAKNKAPVKRYNVNVVVGKKVAGRFVEIVDACEFEGKNYTEEEKRYRVLIGCIRFIYEITKSWNDAYAYPDSQDVVFKITSLPVSYPPHSVAANHPTLRAMDVRGITEDDKPVHYSEKLGMMDIACLINIGKFLGVNVKLDDVKKQTKVGKEQISLIVNTLVWYTHTILIERGKKNINRMEFVVKTKETPSSEVILPLEILSSWKAFLEGFLKNFCKDDYFA